MREVWSTLCLSSICWMPIVMFAAGLYIGRNGIPFDISITRKGQTHDDYEIEV